MRHLTILAFIAPVLLACGDQTAPEAAPPAAVEAGGAGMAATPAEATASSRALDYEVSVEGLPQLTGTIMSRQPVTQNLTMIHTIPRDAHGVLQATVNVEEGSVQLMTAMYTEARQSCGFRLAQSSAVSSERVGDRHEVRGTVSCRSLDGVGEPVERAISAWIRAAN